MTERLRDDCFALPPGIEWTPVDEALALLRAGMRCVAATQEVALGDGAGRVLAQPVIARRSNPPAANSAIDGYAFAWASLAGAAEGDLVLLEGRSAAGHPYDRAVEAGAAVRILTGAEIPAGTDTVVLQEDSEVADGRVRFRAPRQPGSNSRKAGEDAEAGSPVLPAGRWLTPADLARAAAVGVARLTVHKRLRLGVLSTGDELMQPGADPAGAGVFDANRPMLAALAAAQGFDVVDLGAVADRPALVRAALDRGAAQADAIVTTGGASAGDEDHVSRILTAEGRISTWRIAVKPGRPLALGFWQGVPVFGLPGNPVAAFVCFLIFARPALSVMAGAGWRQAQAFMVPAGFEKTKKPGRREYLRARMRGDGHVEVFHSEGSGLIGGLSWADGLVELPDGAVTIRPGDPVRYLPFSSFGLRP
jgi:molybdopterin molybdotransferase